MNIAIFGGSFNPITKGHIKIIEILLKNPTFDKIIIIPCGNRNDKPDLIDGEIRLEMMLISIKTNFNLNPPVLNSQKTNIFQIQERLILDIYEIRIAKTMVPTSNLIQIYQNSYPTATINFVMGSDLLPYISSWELFNEYLKFQHFIIFLRTKDETIENCPLLNYIVQTEAVTIISSSSVRDKFLHFWSKANQKTTNVHEIECLLSDFIQPELIQYIIKKQLYRNGLLTN